jgi:hypothetical protein
VQTPRADEQILHRISAMDLTIVQQNNQMTADLV